MKKAPSALRTASSVAYGELSQSTPGSAAGQSTAEIIERCRLAVEESKVIRKDARVVIAESKTITAMLKRWAMVHEKWIR